MATPSDVPDDDPAVTAGPGGTVTFLTSDIEGSTRLLQAIGDRYGELLTTHHRLLRGLFARHGGTEVDAAGDGLFYTFRSARSALLAAVDTQRAMAGQAWPDGVDVRLRIGLHTGEPISGEVGYIGLDVHRAARIGAAGHGGQILVSQTTRDLVGDLPGEIRLVDLGEHWLKDLAAPERLFQAAGPGLAVDFPPLRSVDARPNNLPRQLTSFIGREETVGEAKQSLRSAPMVTLTGPGGVGKTRLALEIAADVLPEFEGGAWFVELGALADSTFVPQAVAMALGVVERPGRPVLEAIVEHARSRPILLVLDNCEHLLDASATTANALLRAVPGLRIVATSREALQVPGEALFPVPSLSLPDADAARVAEGMARYEAVRLFAERAMAVLPSFRVTDQNAAAIAQVCRRLDGVPLAIELAAARVRALPVEQIAARLDDRFRLLVGSSRLAVARHQTLRATIDWSFDLLGDVERAVLRRLSVFAGGCGLEAAEAVCGADGVAPEDVLEILTRLVDKSLIVAEAAGAVARYRLLETIRQYARDRLLESGEAESTLRRHRDWYLDLAEQAAPQFFRGPESASWLERLDADHENLRAALQWSEDDPGEARAGLRLAASLWRFWEIRGHLVEGRAWLERMLAAADEPTVLRANALTGAGILASMEGDYSAASAFHEASLALHRRLGEPHGIGYATGNLAAAALMEGDLARARQLYEASIDIAREMQDEQGAAFGLMNMADVVARDGDVDRAHALFEESLATFRRFGDRWGESFALDNYGLVEASHGDLAQARSLQESALAISRELRDDRGAARTLIHLAEIALREGDLDRAASLCRQGLAIRQGLRDLPGTAAALESLAWVMMSADPEATARLLGAAESLRATTRAFVPPASRADYEARLVALGAVLDREKLDRAMAEGRAMSPPEVLATLPR